MEEIERKKQIIELCLEHGAPEACKRLNKSTADLCHLFTFLVSEGFGNEAWTFFRSHVPPRSKPSIEKLLPPLRDREREEDNEKHLIKKIKQSIGKTAPGFHATKKPTPTKIAKAPVTKERPLVLEISYPKENEKESNFFGIQDLDFGKISSFNVRNTEGLRAI